MATVFLVLRNITRFVHSLVIVFHGLGHVASHVAIAEAKSLLGTSMACIAHEQFEFSLFVHLEEFLFLGCAVIQEFQVLWMTMKLLNTRNTHKIITSIFQEIGREHV